MLIQKSLWIRKRENNVILVALGETPRGLTSSKLDSKVSKTCRQNYRKQLAIDLTLTNCKNTFAYLDDILIITKGSVEKHKETLEKVLHRLDDENLAISLDKCKFACKQIKWLRFHIDTEETTLLLRKIDAIEKLSPPEMFKQLKSFMGSIHHLT